MIPIFSGMDSNYKKIIMSVNRGYPEAYSVKAVLFHRSRWPHFITNGMSPFKPL